MLWLFACALAATVLGNVLFVKHSLDHAPVTPLVD
jgi:hypothetical protein